MPVLLHNTHVLIVGVLSVHVLIVGVLFEGSVDVAANATFFHAQALAGVPQTENELMQAQKVCRNKSNAHRCTALSLTAAASVLMMRSTREDQTLLPFPIPDTASYRAAGIHAILSGHPPAIF